MRTPDRELIGRVANLLKAEPVGWQPAEHGYTLAERWTAKLPGGTEVFIKAAGDAETARWLTAEYMVQAALQDEPFVPRLIGWDPGPWPLLAREDVGGQWAPPWTAERLADMERTLTAMAAAEPPARLNPAGSYRRLKYWHDIQIDPKPSLDLNLCCPEWLRRSLPAFIAAEDAAKLDGGHLLHMDLRGDNIAFTGRGVVLIDWDHAAIGNPDLDRVLWLVGVALEGGPKPWEARPVQPEIVALWAGFFLHEAARPAPAGLDPTVRQLQKKQAAVALEWGARLLGIAPPR